MSDIFRFKQFAIDQAGCTMKVNTDGVLLGALVGEYSPQHILDIGTGTGVIALMLAQRFPGAQIDAIEIDPAAAATAHQNFAGSPFAERLKLYKGSFADVLQLQLNSRKYDCIISNPPFYINSLHPSNANKKLAKHADADFFTALITACALHLNSSGQCWLILPPDTAAIVADLCFAQGLYQQENIAIKSFPDSAPHRLITAFGFNSVETKESELYIYDMPKIYSAHYQEVLKDFLTIF